MNRLIIAITGIASLAGCASPLPLIDYYGADSQALRKYRHVTVLADGDPAAGRYDDLGEVEGLYCNRTQSFAVESAEAKRSAIDQLRLRAAGQGADAISAPRCELRTTWDLTNNCFSTITCRGRALAIAAD